jgi:hypothetical protein
MPASFPITAVMIVPAMAFPLAIKDIIAAAGIIEAVIPAIIAAIAGVVIIAAAIANRYAAIAVAIVIS